MVKKLPLCETELKVKVNTMGNVPNNDLKVKLDCFKMLADSQTCYLLHTMVYALSRAFGRVAVSFPLAREN